MPLIAVILAITLAACAARNVSPEQPTAESWHARAVYNGQGAAKKKNGPLIDHGGAVLASSTTYAIYWGTPSDFPADLEAGMAALLSGFKHSGYLDIASQYMRGATASTTYAGSITDTSAPPRKPPSTSAIAAEVCKLVPAPNPEGVYIVFTSNAPNVPYCAWHDRATCNGVTFQVAYVPNQELLPACSPYVKADLGCNDYSEGTVTSADSVAHEFMEAITDAHLDAWYDKNGLEVADKCEYNYQSCVDLGRESWQIQSEWSNAIGGCQQQ